MKTGQYLTLSFDRIGREPCHLFRDTFGFDLCGNKWMNEVLEAVIEAIDSKPEMHDPGALEHSDRNHSDARRPSK
jgi:hypothetical protein